MYKGFGAKSKKFISSLFPLTALPYRYLGMSSSFFSIFSSMIVVRIEKNNDGTLSRCLCGYALNGKRKEIKFS